MNKLKCIHSIIKKRKVLNNFSNYSKDLTLKGSLYRRPLPENLIPFSSEAGRKLFLDSMIKGEMEQFFPLIEQFHTQNEPAYCGLGTIAMVLNALGIDPGRLWKGPWRYFSEEKLETCKKIENIKKNGITFQEFCCISKLNGAHVEKYLASETTKENFRNEIKKSIESMKTENESHVVVSFDRSKLGQTGTGHFSPIGGYNEEKDMVLILDVARFKYPPYWTSIDLLWDSLLTVDEDSGTSRGFCSISRFSSCSILCHITNKHRGEWKELVEETCKNLVQSKQSFEMKDFIEVVSNEIDKISDTVPQFNQKTICQDHYSLTDNLYHEAKKNSFFSENESREKIILICLYLFSTEFENFESFPENFKEEFVEFQNENIKLKMLNDEIVKVSKEIIALPLCNSCNHSNTVI
eukprot:gene9317-1405_t